MKYRTSGAKTSKRGAEHHTISTLGRSAELQSRYFAAIHGGPHLEERKTITHRLVNLHDGRTDDFSVDFMVDTRNRMVADYNESCCDGVRMLLRIPQWL